MIKYFQTLENVNFLKIDTESLDATLLFIRRGQKFKSNVVNIESYNAMLEDVKNVDVWKESDETIFNDMLSQIP